jgi:hypothetical protein
MKAKEMYVARGASSIPSLNIKACASPFITKVGASLISNIERCTLEKNISVLYALYKARSQLGQNSGGTRSALFLPYSYCFFSFLEVPSKNLAVMN